MPNSITRPLILLQNPWSPAYAGKLWPEASWLRALRRSPTGRRLDFMIEGKWMDFDFNNTTPEVAPDPRTVLPWNVQHMERIIADRPYIIACGTPAYEALVQVWSGAMLAIPHPAYRLLTNNLLVEARRFIINPLGRNRLHQRKGHVEWTTIPLKKPHEPSIH